MKKISKKEKSFEKKKKLSKKENFDLEKNQEALVELFKEFLKKENLDLENAHLIKIPVSIFKKELGCFESIVKYLKENKKYSTTKISQITKRAKPTISISYKKAKEKHLAVFEEETEHHIPLNKAIREGSVLGNIILYLYQEKLLGLKKISALLNRSYQTIWITFKKRRDSQWKSLHTQYS